MAENPNTENRSPEAAKKGCMALLLLLVFFFLVGRHCSHNAEEKDTAPTADTSSQTRTKPSPTPAVPLADTLKTSVPKVPEEKPHTAYSPMDASCDEGYADGYENGYASGRRGLSYDSGYYYGDGSNPDPAAVAKYRECYDEGYQDGYYNGQAEYSAEQERIREEEERINRMHRQSWKNAHPY